MSNESESAELFELKIRVQPSDIDELGHVNNVSYVRWIQELAQAHWNARAPKQDQDRFLWIVLRHEIDYLKAARLGDEVLGRTWINSATRARFERVTELRGAVDGALIAKARTIWCPIDARTRRPARVDPVLLQSFVKSAEP